LAIAEDAIRHDANGFFFLLFGGAPENEQRGSVAIVNIRGALTQFKGDGGDSYEAIVERVSEAFAADPPPSDVVLRISSPGGLVAGLDRCVRKLQRMSKEAKIPLTAYVDELAASAAYALCCACSEVLTWKSGIVGSIGVISQMVSVAENDKKEGIDFRIITSGKRKADGHLHVPISKDAMSAEEARNEELARQFFELAAEAREMSSAKIAGLEAAIYLGVEAKKVGLVDDVIDLDEALFGLDTSQTQVSEVHAPNEGNVTDRRARDASLDRSGNGGSSSTHQGQPLPGQDLPTEDFMAAKLNALIKRTEAAIATETDPRKKVALQAKLSSFLVARAEMDGDDGDGDGKDKDSDDEGDDESKAQKAKAKAAADARKAEAAKHRAKASEHKVKYEEAMEAAKKCEEDEADEAHVNGAPSQASIPSVTATELVRGGLSEGAAAALLAQAEAGRDAMARLEKLERGNEAAALAASIESARAARRITPHEAKVLASKSAGFVKDFLEMRPKALLRTEEEALNPRDAAAGTPPGSAAGLPAEVLDQIEQAIAATSLGRTEEQKMKLRERMIAAHQEAAAKGGEARY